MLIAARLLLAPLAALILVLAASRAHRPSVVIASLYDAVRPWDWAAVPLIGTAPVGGSLTLVTTAVAALATLSAVPWPSV